MKSLEISDASSLAPMKPANISCFTPLEIHFLLHVHWTAALQLRLIRHSLNQIKFTSTCASTFIWVSALRKDAGYNKCIYKHLLKVYLVLLVKFCFKRHHWFILSPRSFFTNYLFSRWRKKKVSPCWNSSVFSVLRSPLRLLNELRFNVTNRLIIQNLFAGNRLFL